MNELAVIAVAYNRSESLNRLLKSLASSNYDDQTTDLIISIDHSEIQNEMVELAEKFNWQHGKKIIRALKSSHGLRNHILSCGDLTSEYDAVIIFEDDIIAAQNYLHYIKHALQYYSADERIAGISLYSPTINEMVLKPFVPIPSSADVYFIQSAQSWGQCWTKSMWKSFRKWYKKNCDVLTTNQDMPSKIYSWPETSWKKYYMKYIVETNKYFVYPYISLSTNSGDIGQHVKLTSNMFQVPLLQGEKNYKFATLEEGNKYDVFFEAQDLNLATNLGIKNSDLCIDLYGSKPTNNKKRYVLSIKKMEFKVLRSYGLNYRPHEANVIFDESGNDIYLYDMGSNKSVELIGRPKIKSSLNYYANCSWKDSILLGFFGLGDYLKKKILFFL